MKRLLILGAGFLQKYLIIRAKELGYYTLVLDKRKNAVGYIYADEYAVIDIVNKEACLKYAMEKQIDGVVTAATDYAVISVAYVAEKMNLKSVNMEAAEAVKNKYTVRKSLALSSASGVSQFLEVSSESDVDNIINKLSYPVIVKPCDGSGSKGINRVDKETTLLSAVTEALSFSLCKKVIIETYVEGMEYGAECFVIDGTPHILTIMGKHMTLPPHYAELGHYIPSKLTTEDNIKKIISNAIKLLKIDFGPINIDFLLTNDGKVTIIDIGLRCGGNLIYSHIIPYGTGVEYRDILIKSALNEPVSFEPVRTPRSVATRILALKPGTIKKLPDFTKIEKTNHVLIEHHMEVGDKINLYHNNLDGCGYVVAIADTLVEAETNAENAKQEIDSEIIRE